MSRTPEMFIVGTSAFDLLSVARATATSCNQQLLAQWPRARASLSLQAGARLNVVSFGTGVPRRHAAEAAGKGEAET
eukprot:2540218-Lingulodinium_polyedra.AAC.1